MIVLRSPSGDIECSVVPENGGRIGSLVVAGRELLVTGDSHDDPLSWGCYPMVPYAGRVRNATLNFAGRSHALRVNMMPHSIHGTVFDRAWSVIENDATSAVLEIELGAAWPFAATVRHRIQLSNDEVLLTLNVSAIESTPIQVGWHPWFVKPVSTQLGFASMLERDATGIASEKIVDRPEGPVDDCFVDPVNQLTLHIKDLTVFLNSDCSHWVVYDVPAHATCVEPQSGAPNEINDRPFVLEPGGQFARTFSMRFASFT